MNSNTQKSYGSRIGIQASQLISREPKANDSIIALGNLSENLNRFLSAHSRKNINQTTRKFRLNEYFTKDLKAKTSSTHHFLCGPLNTKRLTRKTISGNFNNEQKPTVADLYNNSKQINTKPPWIEEPEHCNVSEDGKKPSEPKSNFSFQCNPRFDKNSTNGIPRLVDDEQVLQDGQVPDPTHIDLNDSCPLYDGNEYEESHNANDVKKISDDEDSEPDISRYNFFLPSCSSEKISNDDINNTSERIDRRSDQVNNYVIRSKPIPRENVFMPLLTSSQDYDFSIVE